MLRIAYFGLPLGALLLAKDGYALSFCALPPISAPGGRRLRQRCARIFDANELGAKLEAHVDAELAARTPDLVVSWFWTRRLPVRWLESAKIDAIGVHPSLLPRHRGRNPYYWAIDSGDLTTGVSVHRLEAEYDVGAVLDQESIDIERRNSWQLARALDRPSLRALRRVVGAYARGTVPLARPQDEALATSAPEPSGELLRVDFRWPTERVLRRIRALSPVPGLALTLGGLDFFVTAAIPTSAHTPALHPGEAQIVGERLLLRTGDGAIAIEGALVDEATDEGPDTISGAELSGFLAGRLGDPLEQSLAEGPWKRGLE